MKHTSKRILSEYSLNGRSRSEWMKELDKFAEEAFNITVTSSSQSFFYPVSVFLALVLMRF